MTFSSSSGVYAWSICSVCMVLSACGHPAQRRLEGRWTGEAVENIDTSLLAAATGWVKGTSFEFSGREITVTIPTEEPRTGTYQVTSFHDDQAKLAVKSADGRNYGIDLRLDDDRSMRWMVGEGRAVVMHKAE